MGVLGQNADDIAKRCLDALESLGSLALQFNKFSFKHKMFALELLHLSLEFAPVFIHFALEFAPVFIHLADKYCLILDRRRNRGSQRYMSVLRSGFRCHVNPRFI